MRKAEKEYYLSKLKGVKYNLKKTRTILNNIIFRTSSKDVISEITCNDKTITDLTEIANKFNVFFANVGSNLARTIPLTTRNFKDFLPQVMFIQFC